MASLDLPSSLDQLIQRQKAVFTDLAKGLGSLVIMGTGHLGRTLAERLPGYPVTLECFCDNDPAKQGTTFLGRPVLAVDEAVRRYGGRAVFVVGIYNGSAGEEQLRRLGCDPVVTAATLCRHFGAPLNPLCSIDYPSAIYAERAEVERCAQLWADERSRTEFAKVLDWFLATRQETLVEHDPAAETYFPADLWNENPAEHFVDCGAFDGDSVRFLLGKAGYEFRAMTAFEPDPGNLEKLKATVAALPEAERGKIRVINAALGAATGEVHFASSGGMDAAVTKAGEHTVRCVRLDDELAGDPPTFLKMDIEGYELEALAGGRETIAAHGPILAITTYHKVAHLWQIPLLVHSFYPDYRLYLRRYAEDCWETVCYAVPPARQKLP